MDLGPAEGPGEDGEGVVREGLGVAGDSGLLDLSLDARTLSGRGTSDSREGPGARAHLSDDGGVREGKERSVVGARPNEGAVVVVDNEGGYVVIVVTRVRVAVCREDVGLGVGTCAAHSSRGERLTFQGSVPIYLESSCHTRVSQAGTVGTEVLIAL